MGVSALFIFDMLTESVTVTCVEQTHPPIIFYLPKDMSLPYPQLSGAGATGKPSFITRAANHMLHPAGYLPLGVAAIAAGGWMLAFGLVSWYTEREYNSVTGKRREASFVMNIMSIAIAAIAIIVGIVLIFLWNSARKVAN